jgi:2-methylisocitrate lyase-like PEP mutase family enzyme
MTPDKPVTTQFKELINRGYPYLHVYPRTPIVAKMLEALGFEASSVPGTVVNDLTNRADDGTRTMTETVTIVKNFADAVRFPLWVDVDACFGGILQVERTVRELIHAGAAGMMMEDQPLIGKRFGGMVGKEVIPIDEAVAKFRVAVDTKNQIDPDFQIIARCDALGAWNAGTLEETIERLQAYKAAGADALSLEAPRTFDEIRKVRNAVDGPMTCPQYNLERETTLEEAADLGIYSVIMGSVNVAIHRFIWEFLKSVKAQGHGAIDDFHARYPTTSDGPQLNLRQLQGLDHILELEERYLGDGKLEKYAVSAAGAGVYDPRHAVAAVTH